MRPDEPEMPADVAAVFAGFPADARARLLSLRRLIYETADALTAVGPLTETLKWGEPAYLTEASKSGSTIRLGWKRASPNRVALYFNCKTTLVEGFRAQFADELTFEGNRAILVPITGPLPEKALASCVAAALTYHRKGA